MCNICGSADITMFKQHNTLLIWHAMFICHLSVVDIVYSNVKNDEGYNTCKVFIIVKYHIYSNYSSIDNICILSSTGSE